MMLTLGTVTLITSAAALVAAVLGIDILTAIGAVRETFEQRAFEANREESMGTFTAGQMQSIIDNAVRTALSQLEDMPGAPDYSGGDTDDTIATDATVRTGRPAGMSRPTLYGTAVPIGTTNMHRAVKAHGHIYRVPPRLQSRISDNGRLGQVWSWRGRKGQPVYGVLIGSVDNERYVQVVDEVTLKPKSRVVSLPRRAIALEGPPVTPEQENPVAHTPVTHGQENPVAHTPVTPEENSAEEKPFIVFASKRTGLMAREGDKLIVRHADDVEQAVSMIRRGYVPHALTIEQAQMLIADNPRHWPSN